VTSPSIDHSDAQDTSASTRAIWGRAALASLTAILLIAAAATVAHRQDLRHQEALLATEGGHAVELEREFLSRELQTVRSDLRFLAQQPELERFLAGRSEGLSALKREYVSFALSKPLYDQIRLLDESGREVVRVNRRGDELEVVEAPYLQSKGSRYYFRDAIALPPGEIYVSPLDLNVERGEIELPPRPVVRLATPVLAASNRARALIVLNYAGGELLSRLREIARASPGQMLLIDLHGGYIQAPNPKLEWGEPLGHDARFRLDHPIAWEKISQSRYSQIRVGDDLFTAAWVPLADGAARRDSAIGIISRISVRETNALRPGWTRLALLFLVFASIGAIASYWARSTVAKQLQDRRIADSEARLRVLSSRLLAAQEEERRSLSRRLHDELGQQVTAIALDLRSTLPRAGDQEATIRRAIAEAEAVLSGIHELATRVRPSILDDLGLEDAIESFMTEYQERSGVRVTANLGLAGAEFSDAVAENVYRIIQEALSNVATHAETDAVRVDLSIDSDSIDLVVEDEGRGFDTDILTRSTRLGILGMQERVELLGGEFELKTAPGAGTRIHVRLPLAGGFDGMGRERDRT